MSKSEESAGKRYSSRQRISDNRGRHYAGASGTSNPQIKTAMQKKIAILRALRELNGGLGATCREVSDFLGGGDPAFYLVQMHGDGLLDRYEETLALNKFQHVYSLTKTGTELLEEVK